MKQQWRQMGAVELGRGIGAGEICPVALTEMFLDTARHHPDRDRIYTRMMVQQALDTAAAARGRAKSGRRRGPLDGVPVSWKDLFDTAGVATEGGSALLRGRTPQRNATVVERLTGAGLPPLGKTHMTEFAYSGLGLNPVTATPPCINNPDAVPGGSSSGAAASVAFGLAPLAIGSDTGGSVRIPAAWNDLVGLKTSVGAVPNDGVLPLAPRFDTVGPLARCVEDAAHAFALLAARTVPDLHGASLRGVRLLVLQSVAFDDIRDAPESGFEAATESLARAGARIDRAHVGAVTDAMALSQVIYTPECLAQWRDLIESDPAAVFPPILERFRSGAAHSAVDHVAAWDALARHRRSYRKATAGYDAVILPTAPNMPPDTERLLTDHAYFSTENLLTLRNTRIGNLLGLCALTLPTGTPSVGISLMAQPGSEAALLRLGAAAEAALGAR